MAIVKTEAQSDGIKQHFKKYNPSQSIAEFIWNAIDADASTIKVHYSLDKNGFNSLISLSISDDGSGIEPNNIQNLFTPILLSSKRKIKKERIAHGSKGLGRLAFFCLSSSATWHSKSKETEKSIKIKIDKSDLSSYEHNEELKPSVGTIVEFHELSYSLTEELFNQKITPYLEEEFAQILTFKPNLQILINEVPINRGAWIQEKLDLNLNFCNFDFRATLIQWKKKLHNKGSKFYFSTNDYGISVEIPTSLNNKGDQFIHSVFIYSDFFKHYIPKIITNNEDLRLSDLFSNDDNLNIVFKQLLSAINKSLQEMANPNRARKAKELIHDYEKNKIFPKSDSKYDDIRIQDIKDTIYELYLLEPKLFTGLKQPQQKIIIAFFDRLLQNSQNDALFHIISEILSLDSTQLSVFSEQLATTKLSNMIRTMQILIARKKIIHDMERMIYSDDLFKTYEVHIQKMMEQNYWLIDEKYHLIAAEEKKWDTIFRDLVDAQSKSKTKKLKNNGGLREPDLVIVRPNIDGNITECVVIELKKPSVSLSNKEFQQTKDYLNIVRASNQVNGNSFKWTFYLLGKDINPKSLDIQDGYEQNRMFGKDLAYNVENGKYRIFIKKWCDVFNEFNIKYDYLYSRLDSSITQDTECQTANAITDKLSFTREVTIN